MNRPVDHALEQERAAKSSIRNLWLSEIEFHLQTTSNNHLPLYVTLPGSHGIDIQLLIENEIIELTETGGIDEKDTWKVVAVEKDSEAILALQQKFPNLKILQSPIEDLLHGYHIHAWPNNEVRENFKAKVVNLDFEGIMRARQDNGHPWFPFIRLIRKISIIHAGEDGSHQPIDWSICLTFNADINWSEEAEQYVQEILSGNVQNQENFRTGVQEILGQELANSICDLEIKISELDEEQRWKFLTIIVPKLIFHEIIRENWRAESIISLNYGATPNQARMFTSIIRFRQTTPIEPPDIVYSRNVNGIPGRCGIVSGDGVIELYLED